VLTVGREITGVLDRAIATEWLVTNGIGGFASGTVSGISTRRYHGLLIAALRPPLGRTMMLARIDEELIVEDRSFYLGANEFHDGTINPHGFIHLREVRIDNAIPTFVYDVPGATIQKTIWLDDGQNTTNVLYELAPGSRPVTLRASLFLAFRDFHREMTGAPDWAFLVNATPEGHEIAAYEGATPLRVRAIPDVRLIQTGVWYWRFLHRVERDRGLDFLEDLYTPGLFVANLKPGETVAIQASTEPWKDLASDPVLALARRHERQRGLISSSPVGIALPDAYNLVVAADAFLVRARSKQPAEHLGGGIIAGYPWFSEWGRDTMIALPGLLIANARLGDARDVLRRYARLIDHGQVPNRLPDSTGPAEYNTIDAALWFLEAIERYLDASRDDDFLHEMFPVAVDIIRWHREGTRFGIGVDSEDGLLRGGAPGQQLTWMDARVDEWVVTPRRGKPVEVNALWYNALRLMASWARRIDQSDAAYREQAAQAYSSFNRRYWNPDLGYLFDVVDGENGDDASLRPNQLFAIGLTFPTLDPRRWDAVIDRVEEKLVTPFGLRSLSPDDPAYVGLYRGDQRRRDAAYHQGTAWPWLLGVYADACRRAGRDLGLLRAALDQLTRVFGGHGLGTIGEIFDGDPPHQPGGCIAQAWSVSEVLRAWQRASQE
jgi:predicted glycogen debranching enzyme